jgi:hypothetical protein
MDGAALREIRQTYWDENPDFAKVRVAGSSPVFRSIAAGQGSFSTPLRTLPKSFAFDPEVAGEYRIEV